MCVYYMQNDFFQGKQKAPDYVIWQGKLRREFLAVDPQSWSFISRCRLKANMENTGKFNIWKYLFVYMVAMATLKLRCGIGMS